MLPSTKEGQALVSIEAFSCGLPVVINKKITDSLGSLKEYENHLEIDLDKKELKELEGLKNFKNRDRKKISNKIQLEHHWSAIAIKYIEAYKLIIK